MNTYPIGSGPLVNKATSANGNRTTDAIANPRYRTPRLPDTFFVAKFHMACNNAEAMTRTKAKASMIYGSAHPGVSYRRGIHIGTDFMYCLYFSPNFESRILSSYFAMQW